MPRFIVLYKQQEGPILRDCPFSIMFASKERLGEALRKAAYEAFHAYYRQKKAWQKWKSQQRGSEPAQATSFFPFGDGQLNIFDLFRRDRDLKRKYRPPEIYSPNEYANRIRLGQIFPVSSDES